MSIWRSVNIEDPVPELYTPILKVTKKQSLDYIRRVEQKHKDLNIVKHIWTCEGTEFIHGPNFSGYAPCLTCDPCKRALEIGLINKNLIPGQIVDLENLLDKKVHVN